MNVRTKIIKLGGKGCKAYRRTVTMTMATFVAKYLNPNEDRYELCANCPNRNNKLSCSPKSPYFLLYAKGVYKVKIVNVIVKRKDIMEMYPNYKAKPYLAMSFAHKATKSSAEHYVRDEASYENDLFLIAGSCKKCKKCAGFEDKPCRKTPEYSMESVGINVDKLAEDVFETPLEWGSSFKRMQAYTCILYKEDD